MSVWPAAFTSASRCRVAFSEKLLPTVSRRTVLAGLRGGASAAGVRPERKQSDARKKARVFIRIRTFCIATDSVRQLRPHQLAQLHHQLVLHAVIDALAFLVACQNAGRSHQRKVFGHVRLRGAGGRHDLAHGARLVADGLQNPQPHRLAEQLEPTGQMTEFILRQQRC